jgi:hypothetical protein
MTFPAFYDFINNPAFLPIINNFLPIGDWLLLQALIRYLPNRGLYNGSLWALSINTTRPVRMITLLNGTQYIWTLGRFNPKIRINFDADPFSSDF